jgi:hypothetical protein
LPAMLSMEQRTRASDGARALFHGIYFKN